jgi:hypothetical protein
MSESDIEFDSDFPTFDFNVKMPLPVIVGRIAATVPSYLQLIIESGPGPQAAVRVTRSERSLSLPGPTPSHGAGPD